MLNSSSRAVGHQYSTGGHLQERWNSPTAIVVRPAIRDGDLYQPMWPELEALVGSAMRAANLRAERSPLLPSDGLRRSIARVRVP